MSDFDDVEPRNPQAKDDRVLACIMRRFINDVGSWGIVETDFGHKNEVPFLYIEGQIELSEAELEAIAAAEVPT